MNFVETLLQNTCQDSSKVIFSELHGDQRRPVSQTEFRQWVGSAQAFLRSQNVQKGDRVALLAPNSAKWAAFDLAIMAMGAITVPLYSRQELDELAFMIQDCDASLVAVWDYSLGQNVQEKIGDIPVFTFEDMFRLGFSEPVMVPIEESDVVTIVYTSGTSSNPKGVMLHRGNVDYMIEQTRRSLEETYREESEPERAFHFLPVCFMGSRMMLWTQMVRACELWLSTDLSRLKEELSAANPHYFLNVPAILERVRSGVNASISEKSIWLDKVYRRAMAAELNDGKKTLLDRLCVGLARKLIFPKIKSQIGSNLQFLICGSAPLHPETQAWFGVLGISVLQVYGLTETTAIISMDRVGQTRCGYVGLAIEGCEVSLTEEGELRCKGPNVFPGYWNRPDETQEMLKDGWLYTGDQAEIDDQGRIRIKGRVKNIIVAENGHNITPEPIEEALIKKCKGVEQVVVIGHGRPYLTAIVTGMINEPQFRDRLDVLNKELPHYRRIKDVIVSKDEFTPENGMLTANHKLRRKQIETHYHEAIEQLYQKAGKSL